MARRINFGNKNKIPISISKRPSPKINWLKVRKGRVFWRRESTRGFAALVPKTLIAPNQKYIRNREKRAKLTFHLPAKLKKEDSMLFKNLFSIL